MTFPSPHLNEQIPFSRLSSVSLHSRQYDKLDASHFEQLSASQMIGAGGGGGSTGIMQEVGVFNVYPALQARH